jgi:hypothetical protein
VIGLGLAQRTTISVDKRSEQHRSRARSDRWPVPRWNIRRAWLPRRSQALEEGRMVKVWLYTKDDTQMDESAVMDADLGQ